MPPMRDLTGELFGRWYVEGPAYSDGQWHWWCVCLCEKRTAKVLTTGALKSGHSKSCGCYNVDAIKERSTTHGMTGTPTYRAWQNMKSRCYNPNDQDYPNYGGRKIKVCDRWKESFLEFLKDMKVVPEGHSLERIHCDRDYDASNCIWLPKGKQAANRRNCPKYELNGKTQTAREWATELGLPYATLKYRLRTGMSIEEAVSVPVGKMQDRHFTDELKWEGKVWTFTALAQRYGLKVGTLIKRYREYGWPLKEALETPVQRKTASHKQIWKGNKKTIRNTILKNPEIPKPAKKYKYKGEDLTLRQIILRSGTPLNTQTLRHRIEKSGLSIEDALSKPLHKGQVLKATDTRLS